MPTTDAALHAWLTAYLTTHPGFTIADAVPVGPQWYAQQDIPEAAARVLARRLLMQQRQMAANDCEYDA